MGDLSLTDNLAAPSSPSRSAWGTLAGRADPGIIRSECFHDLFEAVADRFPHRIAIECDDESLTYADLDRAANRCAHHLRQQALCPGDKVAILLPRSPQAMIAMLAVLKSGAAYVPLDPDCPTQRIAHILADSAAKFVLTDSSLAARHEIGPTIAIEMDAIDERSLPPGRLPAAAGSSDLSYIIYTSGSTGVPKGVEVEHRSVCHLVRAEAAIFDVQPQDRVFQGFSMAFDASIEEIWLAFFAGATLVIATSQVIHSGADLAAHLSRQRITVLSCVPTLLSMMADTCPDIRLLIVGGEPCPADLVRRWARPGRRIVNTYGPTEATVIATFGDLTPDRPVTLGRPLPNTTIRLLDDKLQTVEPGEAGEICIGGIGLARGYTNRPDQTARRFIPDPLAPAEHPARLYRTGDLGRINLDGQLEFIGRNDLQVKIRGYRVELAEIESFLLQEPSVQATAVVLRPTASAPAQLVAFVVPRPGQTIDPHTLRACLRPRLPAYMMPSRFVAIDALPMLSSGKVDRAALAQRHLPDAVGRTDPGEPQSLPPDQAQLAQVWARLFELEAVSADEDFFVDLGGHSLLAATMVSQLRHKSDFADLSVPDVYAFPTISRLCAELAARRQQRAALPAGATIPRFNPTPRRFALCGVAQAAGMVVVFFLHALQWIAPYLAYSWLKDHGLGIGQSVAGALAAVLALYPAMLVLAIAVKWLVIGRYRAGSYRLWGWYYWRWWLVNRILDVAPIELLAGTPLLAWYYRLMGARIGKEVHLGADCLHMYDLVDLGDGTSVGVEASLSGYYVQQGMLHIGPIRAGRDCFIGARSIVGIHTTIEDGAALGELSLLSHRRRIAAGQFWSGSPAKPAPGLAALRPPQPSVPRHPVASLRRLFFALAHAIGIVLLPVVYLMAIFPGVIFLYEISDLLPGLWFIAFAPVVALSFVLFTCLLIAAVKWLLLGKLREGPVNLASLAYLNKWFVDQLMRMSLELLGPLYSTLYLTPWYRLLGVKLGRWAEISTACATEPDLLHIGDHAFVADCVSLGARVDRGVVHHRITTVGRRSFLGNSAFIPAGAQIGDDCLIGVLSTTPLDSQASARAHTSWLGSPPIYLPQRQASAVFPQSQTYQPTPGLIALRLFIEFFRITLPATGIVALAGLIIYAMSVLREEHSLAFALAMMPLVYTAAALLGCGFVIAMKWLLMGRFKPGEHPLWSAFVWRNELVTALHEHMANPTLVAMLAGTPFAAMFFRALGARIGPRAYLETTQFTEYDLVEIGQEAALNDECTIQTHLFEDRVMKMSTIRIGANCAIGAGAVILYDTAMADHSTLGELTLLMKGEHLPPHTSWEGSPAQLRRPVDPQNTPAR